MTTIKKQGIRYFLYARKSSESEDRQIQSIEDQRDRLKEFAKERHLKIVHIYEESKSAKKPNNRPLFTEMLKRIGNGEAEGILCWQINRLSRNPKDGGDIQWMLQNGTLKSIQTTEREYLPGDNALLMAVETGVANQFILDLSKNVRRGIQKKLNDGWRPGMAPTGYMNYVDEAKEHSLIIDPQRFKLLRKAWDLILTGNYTVPQIADKLNNEWGFRTIKKKRLGDKPLALSGMYKVFTNLFYAGIIVHKGVHYPGKHTPLITLEEYDKVQIILGRAGKPRPKKHHFPFTGLFRCPECGCFYTAETKQKLIKSTGKIKEYTYYHCTRKSKKTKCTQNKVLEEQKLFEQLEYELEKYEIIPEFLSLALEIIESRKETEIEDAKKIREMQEMALSKTKNQLTKLTAMSYKELITEEEFVVEREKLQQEIKRLESKLNNAEENKEKVLELTEKTFSFATYAHKEFLKRDLEGKRELILHLGSNHAIKDKITAIQAKEWFVPIANKYPTIHSEYERLEPTKNGSNKVKSEQLSSLITRWHGMRESNSRQRFWRPPYYHYTNPAYATLRRASPLPRSKSLFYFLMQCVFFAEFAIFIHFQFFFDFLLVA